MTRRNALDRIRKDSPQDPIASIPLAKSRKRGREWEAKHPGTSYFIPSHLHEQAKDVRTAILALSQKHMTTTSSVADAFLRFSLSHVRKGQLRIDVRPSGNRRKMTVTWEEVKDGWEQEIPKPVKRGKKSDEDMYLNYRLTRDANSQIKALAGKEIVGGEVVVRLLQYALEAHKRGRLRLKEETVVVAQKVSPTW